MKKNADVFCACLPILTSMSENKISVPPTIILGGVLLIVALVIVYIIYQKIFGNSEDEDKIEQSNEQLENQTKTVGTKTVTLTGNLFEKPWFDKVVQLYGAASVNSYNQSRGSQYIIDADVLEDNLNEYYVTDDQANAVLAIIKKAPTQMYINGVAYQYTKRHGRDLENDLKDGLDDDELAVALSALAKKPVM